MGVARRVGLRFRRQRGPQSPWSLQRIWRIGLAYGLLASFSLGVAIALVAGTVTVTPAIPAAPPPTTSIVASATASSDLDQGRELYRQGQFVDAIAAWQAAQQHYQRTGDRLNQALSLNYISLAQQELNQWDAAATAIQESVALLQAAPQADAIVWAQTLNTQASLQLHQGQAEAALDTWKQAQSYYEQAGDRQGSWGSQINQAQALQSLGFYRRARQQLSQLVSQLEGQPNSELKVSSLRSLGSALQVIGDTQASRALLEKALAIAQNSGLTQEQEATRLSLGKIAMEMGDATAAMQSLTQAERQATNPTEQLQARLELLNLYIWTEQVEPAIALVPQIQQQLQSLPPSRSSIYSTVHFAATLNRLANLEKLIPLNDLAQLLARAVQAAQDLQDPQAAAYALMQQAQLYLRTQQSAEALELTQRSLNLARQLRAENLISQAAWQLGRIQAQQGQRSTAIASYGEAVNALQALRGDLVAINPDIQFSFRESVEPVYRELVGLLLNESPSQAQLIQARNVIEALQVAELDNFFREACLDKTRQIDQVDPTATVVYPIILPDRLAVILSTAGQPLRYYSQPLPQAEVEQTLEQLLAALNPVSDNAERRRLSQQVYDWLIRPAEQAQALKQTETLVFVLDGRLRNIPMAALYDGHQYLIEKYAVTLSPGLQLMGARSLAQTRPSALIAGISEARDGFSALPAVRKEVTEISRQVSGATLLNQQFTNTKLAEQVKQMGAGIVHLATHGQFSSRQEDTFLLTWDGRVNVKELSELLQNRQGDRAIDLLVLSACDTATGDERAVLGLAGLAVKSGARSTVATLWPVRDNAAALLMTQFYQQLLQPSTTKAKALQQAQLAVLKQTDYDDPFFWSAFVLVGNWQ
jgi:CHAT domain-containing protein